MRSVAISRTTGETYNVVSFSGGEVIGICKKDGKPFYVATTDPDFLILLNVTDAMVKMIETSVNDSFDFGKTKINV